MKNAYLSAVLGELNVGDENLKNLLKTLTEFEEEYGHVDGITPKNKRKYEAMYRKLILTKLKVRNSIECVEQICDTLKELIS